MKLLILGAKGLLGEALQKTFADHEVVAYDREELDVTNSKLLKSEIKNLKSEIVINCVAWNDVDGAEREEQEGAQGGVNRAKVLNCEVPKELARITADLGVTLVTYSTDHVFSGEDKNTYKEEDAQNPPNAYGRSKHCGEQAVQKVAKKFYLVRTSRLYGPRPGSTAAKPSFVLMMLELAKTKRELAVVDEEPGAFTYAKDLAQATKKLIEEKFPYGIYHITNNGAATWYECAKEIFNYLDINMALKKASRRDFLRPAGMPKHSILQNTKFPPLRDWKEALHEFLGR